MKLEIKTTIDGNVVTEVGKVNPHITIYRTENGEKVDFYFVNTHGEVLSVMRVLAFMSQGYGIIDSANMLIPMGVAKV